MTPDPPPALQRVGLRGGGVCVLVEIPADTGLPRILYWGEDLGELSERELETVGVLSIGQVTSYVPDEPVPAAVLPEHGLGWSGWPGVSGHRGGADWSPVFSIAEVSRSTTEADDRLVVTATDELSQLGLVLQIQVLASGLVRLRADLTNASSQEPYWVDAVNLTMPVPPVADELLDLAGRHTRERVPQRQPFHVGTRLRESRRGHGGHDASILLAAGTAGFGFRTGEVWAVHLAGSGNHRVYAERLPTGGHALLGGGELLLPGEVRLDPGATYATPWLYGSYSAHGLDAMADRFHAFLRARPSHPSPSRPRPVIVNTWEAVYFDADQAKLLELADRAAQVGAERFVLDDGWFRGRRSDTAGLGDWFVDSEVWPLGLGPLVDRVHDRGMEFGLWVEPESVSPDSDVARAHPEWMLATGGRLPPLSRDQQVLDLGNQEVWDYLLERIDALLSEYRIDFLKWDLNRDVVDGGGGLQGAAPVSRGTHALYGLLDEIRRRHPHVEIESCAGGGGRVDLGILERTDRVWASDNIDPLERQRIQRWTGLLLPPELVGSHVGAAQAHTTHRTHTIDFAGGTALFAHFGVELDLTAMSSAELERLQQWVDLYKRMRPLLHTGRTVRSDHPDPALWIHGVVAHDDREAIFAIVGMDTATTQPPGVVRLPGLDASRRYRVRLLPPAHTATPTRVPRAWLAAAEASGPGVLVAGRVLSRHGIQAPFTNPGTMVLLHLTAEDA